MIALYLVTSAAGAEWFGNCSRDALSSTPLIASGSGRGFLRSAAWYAARSLTASDIPGWSEPLSGRHPRRGRRIGTPPLRRGALGGGHPRRVRRRPRPRRRVELREGVTRWRYRTSRGLSRRWSSSRTDSGTDRRHLEDGRRLRVGASAGGVTGPGDVVPTTIGPEDSTLQGSGVMSFGCHSARFHRTNRAVSGSKPGSHPREGCNGRSAT